MSALISSQCIQLYRGIDTAETLPKHRHSDHISQHFTWSKLSDAHLTQDVRINRTQ